jgi:hypothetical protein
VIYLASPYHAGTEGGNYGLITVNVMRTQHFIARALTAGHCLFSPIVHCHELSRNWGMPDDYEFWWNYNRHMLTLASELWILTLPGYLQSRGIAQEREWWTSRYPGSEPRLVSPEEDLQWPSRKHIPMQEIESWLK